MLDSSVPASRTVRTQRRGVNAPGHWPRVQACSCTNRFVATPAAGTRLQTTQPRPARAYGHPDCPRKPARV